MKDIQVNGNGVRLHAVAAGPEKGPLVVLLHGFPDFWYGWRHQIPALTSAGFRVIALDQRGYNLSDKPPGAKNYRLDLLADDVQRVIEEHGGGPASLIGHDWGGGVTWQMVLTRPELVKNFAVINCPHPKAMLKRLFLDPRQTLSSWYLFFFQLPKLPELLLRRRKYGVLRQGMRDIPTFTKDDEKKYVEAWSQPGAITGGVNWYRAMLHGRPPKPDEKAKHPPGLLIWGTDDPFLREAFADDSAKYYPRLQLEKLAGVGHWAQQQEPGRVNAMLTQFLRGEPLTH